VGSLSFVSQSAFGHKSFVIAISSALIISAAASSEK
jgi:hypothetical protein